MAEIELNHINQPFPKPPWISEEITDDPRYYISTPSRHPYSQWPEDKQL